MNSIMVWHWLDLIPSDAWWLLMLCVIVGFPIICAIIFIEAITKKPD